MGGLRELTRAAGSFRTRERTGFLKTTHAYQPASSTPTSPKGVQGRSVTSPSEHKNSTAPYLVSTRELKEDAGVVSRTHSSGSEKRIRKKTEGKAMKRIRGRGGLPEYLRGLLKGGGKPSSDGVDILSGFSFSGS